MFRKWMLWTVSEGLSRSSGAVVLKVIGAYSQTVAHALLSVAVMGASVAALGLILKRASWKKLFPGKREAALCSLFGFCAAISTTITIVAFNFQAQLGLYVLIVSLFIIPGALLDRIIFKEKLNKFQYLGIAVGIAAFYVILGRPDLSAFRGFPLWIWLGLANAFVVSFNQVLTRGVRHLDPFVMNFWVGLSLTVVCGAALVYFKEYGQGLPFNFWAYSFMASVFSAALLVSNLMGYKRGATVAVKSLMERGSFLIFSLVMGIVFFHESLTINIAMGAVIYFIALYFMLKKKSGKPLKI